MHVLTGHQLQPSVIFSGTDAGKHSKGGEIAYAQYVRHLEKTSSHVKAVQTAGTVENFAQGYQDYLQAPLQVSEAKGRGSCSCFFMWTPHRACTCVAGCSFVIRCTRVSHWQPLMDNLQSITYQTFEQDPVKYRNYEEVRLLAFCVSGAHG